MNEHFRSVSIFVMLAILMTACASTGPVVENQSSASDQVGTIVAMTLQAVAPAINQTPASRPDASGDLLPHALYFLARDDQGVNQVHRMERDGKTVTRLTTEPLDVSDYDVLPVDGSLAYEVNSQLVLVNADGSNRRLVAEGIPGPEIRGIFHPTFSPDGKTLAYSQNGLNLYDLSAAASKLVIEDQYGEPLPDGVRLPIEGYWPEEYSPDGKRLLVALGHWEVPPSHAVYDPDTNTLLRYTDVQDDMYCCSSHGGPVWSPDSASFYGVASAHGFAFQSGELWKVDAGSGAVSRMLAGSNGTLNLPKEPFLAPDGGLYFFLGTYDTSSGYFDAPVLRLVRSQPDGMTDRTVLREENFVMMKEALWAPDASFVIIASAADKNPNQDGGVLELYYTGGQEGPVWLAPIGVNLKWGP